MLQFKEKFFQCCLLFFCFFCISKSNAATWQPTTNNIWHPYTTANTWHFDIAPYLWAVNMNGSVQIGPRNRTHVNESFSDLWDNLDWGGMLWFDAYNGDFGIFVNTLYVALSKTTSDGIYSIKSSEDFTLLGAGLSYQIYQSTSGFFSVIPYVGFRYTSNDATVTLHTSSAAIKATNDQYWTDPIIGARLKFALTKAWLLTLAGDIGGTGRSTHYSYDLTGFISYHPQTVLTSTSVYLGYRLLDQYYQTGSGASYFNWNMKLFGPLLGISFGF